MPNSYGIITGDNSGVTAEASATHDTLAINGDNWLTTTISADKISITHDDANMVSSAAVSDVNPTFGGSFTIVDLVFDNKGHIYANGNGSHRVTIPDISVSNNTDNGADIISALSIAPTTGVISATKTTVGRLPLTGFTEPDTNQQLYGITSEDTINTAIQKLYRFLNNGKDSNNTLTTVNDRIATAVANAAPT